MIPSKRLPALSSDSESELSPRRKSQRGYGRAALVGSVFRSVRREFYNWDRKYAQDVLELIAAEHGGLEPFLPQPNVSPEFSDGNHSTNDTTERFQVTDFDSGATYSMLPPEVTVAQSPLSSTLSYESCSPTSSNIFKGDDSDDMPFIPFADDPEFDYSKHLKRYKFFAWQRLFFDPDLQTITIETARRLFQDHVLSFEEIDNTGVLPLNLLRMETNGGVLLTHMRHDRLSWLPFHIPFTPPPSNTSIRPEFDEMIVGQFCNYMNCLIGFCDGHTGFDVPLPLKVEPTLTSTNLFGNIVEPCSKDCFILGIGDSQLITNWAPEDIEALSIALDYAPDTSPCDLAIICRKPCIEVFRRRKILLPDVDIITRPKRTKHTSASTGFNDLDPTIFSPYPMSRVAMKVHVTADKTALAFSTSLTVRGAVVASRHVSVVGPVVLAPGTSWAMRVGQNAAHASGHIVNAIQKFVVDAGQKILPRVLAKM